MRTRIYLRLAACLVALAPAAGLTQRSTPRAARIAPITPASLVGRWGDNGDCTKDVVFRSDGSFTSFTGGGGSWRLRGQQLTMSGGRGTFVVTVLPISRNAMTVINPDGTRAVSQRC